MIIKVKYKNNRFDFVKGEILDLLIEEGKIKQFYRYSEEKWITVGRDPMRAGRKSFLGNERRSQPFENMSLQ